MTVSYLIIAGCTNGEIRLVGGRLDLTGTNFSDEGRVEICFNDVWGTVCDRQWDDTDAGVVCRQLHLRSNGSHIHSVKVNSMTFFNYYFLGSVAVRGASFGEGIGRIWLDNVQCTGSERQLRNCSMDSGGINSCTHAQDAGVRCSLGTHNRTRYPIIM